ncbi:MAG TPA: ATP-dependent sacrificial sulfur transferase LarE [Candidatus Dormibacteraeota bacterium]|nr:ATP-dependent sacrificial sulfur transferase LarE [Candidatus Dormibacteraeota bacterium]
MCALIASSPPVTLEAKQQTLFQRLAQPRTLLVALSGGADSAYLSWAARQVLGPRVLAVTALSASFSAHDREQVEGFLRHAGIAHEFIDTLELDNPLYVANSRDRCYHCKSELFSQLSGIAAARGFAAIAYGINADDTTDFRPGHRAAAEHQVLAPLLDARLHKSEIRELSRQAGLPTWDRPASACLASRIPYGTPVTIENLSRVERGEAILRELGFLQFRVRYHEELARIEIAPAELPRALKLEMAETLAQRFKQLGFTYVTLDLEGYRQGSLNAAIHKPSKK